MPAARSPYSLIKRKLPSGKVVYYYRYYLATGERSPPRSTGCTTKAAARAYCDQLVREGRIGSTAQRFGDRFAGFWDAESEYVRYQRETARMSEAHRRNSAGILKRDIMPHFQDVRITEIDRRDVQDWLLAFENPRVANRALKTLRTMLNYLVANHEIPYSPAQTVRMRRVEKAKRGILTGPEAARVLDSELWEKHFPNRKHYAMSLVAATTGMRLSEILRLEPEDVHDDHIEVRKTKTGYDRIVPALPEVVGILRELAPIDLHRRTVTVYFKRALDNAKIPRHRERNITFHSWRHFFNTAAQAAGIADGTLRAAIGHRTEDMTVNYTKYLSEHYHELAEVQRRMLDPEAEPEKQTNTNQEESA